MTDQNDERVYYPNEDATPGGDPRVRGTLGNLIARAAWALTLRQHSSTAKKIGVTDGPRTKTFEFGQGKDGPGFVQLSWPPYIAVFAPVYANGDYFSIRSGWRHDPNLGDGNNPIERRMPEGEQGAYLPEPFLLKPRIDHVIRQ